MIGAETSLFREILFLCYFQIHLPSNCSCFSTSEFYDNLRSGLRALCSTVAGCLPSAWEAVDSVVQSHKTKWTETSSKHIKTNKNHLLAEMEIFPKFLEGMWALLWPSEDLINSVLFLNKWAFTAPKSEPRLIPCCLQESLLASVDPALLREPGSQLVLLIVWQGHGLPTLTDKGGANIAAFSSSVPCQEGCIASLPASCSGGVSTN